MTEFDDLHDRLRAGATKFTPTLPDLPDLPTAAAAAGLLDVAYAIEDSPLGPLLLAATDAGLVRVAYLDDRGADDVLASLARQISPRVLAAPAHLDGPRRELDDYFAGRLTRFATTLDGRLMGPFAQRVLAATGRIPYGQTSTYATVAAQAGSPRAWRAAGNALGSNPLPIVVPCHRVLATGGGLGGYTGGVERKRTLLAIESGGEFTFRARG
jgi:methylated-DNA-[protein]-cysteine S-methyltransferase